MSADALARFAPVKILVVDDLADKQLAYRAALEEPGVEVVSAMSGTDALKALLREEFAVILLDVNMPGMDGFETATLIRARKRSAHTPIIFITAHVDDVFAHRGYSSGAVDFLLSPVQADVLRTKVRVFVQLFRLSQQVQEQAARRVAVAESEQARLASILENAADFVARADVQGRLHYVNRAGRRIMGWSDAPGSTPPSVNPSGQCLPEWGLAAARRDGVWFGESSLCDGDGRAIPVSLVILAHRGADGTVECFSVIAHDITERKRAEEAVQKLAAERAMLLESERIARSEAERLGRLKDEFLATLSHELRTPLSAILGWASLLQKPNVKPNDVADGLQIIVRNARLQAQLVSDLLDMNRIVSGKLRLDPAIVDLRKVAEHVISSFRPTASTKDVELVLVGEAESLEVSADGNRIQQIIWNLISNAIKFTPEGGRVEIACAGEGDMAVITIKDSGEGIAPEFLPHIFERFRQADPSYTRRHGGLGLGLAIAKQLVELHGGNIDVRSEGPGQGSTFMVRLPLKEPAEEGGCAERAPTAGHSATNGRSLAAPSSDGQISGDSLRGVRVLVVDDEPDSVNLARRILEDCSAEVTVASSAAEAVEYFRHHRPDVLISDIGMPVEDGYSLMRRIRRITDEDDSFLPAIALTAFARAEDRERSLQAGFQLHVSKPVNPWELVRAVLAVTSTERRDAATLCES